MTPEQKAAFVMAQAACAMAEIAGMQAENQQRIQRGESLAYTEAHFFAVAGRYGLQHNAVLSLFGS